MRRHPHLYEVNARVFMRRVCEKYRQALTLATVPDEEWQLLTGRGFDLVWLMGVWQRSPGARQQALLDSALRREYDKALPGWTDDDVAGSPYAVYAYSLDPALGKQRELAQVKSRLNRRGLGLIVDFVPNHLAFDHPWTLSHPEWFVQGRESDARTHPGWFFSPDGSIYLAHGRDPNFPPWNDTVQVNFYSSDLRQALINELLRIAEVADGVRCDMAMLALNSIFEQVWGEVVKDHPQPETEFWAEAIARVKRQRPDFLFLAEVYWGLELELQQMGFDFTYDKLFYDRLRFCNPGDIRSHLMADDLYQRRSARFIENHDEPRAVAAFGREPSLAAAVVLATVPGLRLFHDGQLEGRRIRLPIHLVREAKEADDPETMRFYDRLLTVCNAPAFHEGKWMLIETGQACEGNERHHSLLAWSCRHSKQFKIVVVNYSPDRAQGWLRLPLPVENMKRVVFRDELTGTTYMRDPDELCGQGLYVDLDPWHAYILDLANWREVQ
jgi:hypothetical protein